MPPLTLQEEGLTKGTSCPSFVCSSLEGCDCKTELLKLCVLRALPDSIPPYPMESGNCPFACTSGIRLCVHNCPLFFPSSQGMSFLYLFYW